jgi:hypothetical protein
LRWSVQRLAVEARISTQTIKRFETVEGVPQSRTQTLLQIKAALEAGGIQFVGTPLDRPGIRIVATKKKQD